MTTKMAVMVVWEHTNADFCCFCFNWNVQRHTMNLSWAPSPTPTRNNRDRRGLSAVTAAKIWNGRDHEYGRYGGLRARRRRFLLCFFLPNVQQVVMSLSWAPSLTPTRNNCGCRALSAVTAPKFETAGTGMAVMVVWEHEDADFCCVSSHET